jgi:hypothetical protein
MSPDDPGTEVGAGQADTRTEPDGKLLSFPDAGMRSNRKADSQRVELARELFEDRRLRPKVFADTAMFGEGAWDILLALYAAEHGEDYAPSADSMLASEQPHTTIVRWMSYLESVGLIAHTQDGAPTTMRTIRLLPKGLTMLNAYLDQVRERRAENPVR